ncbi:MAG: spermidine/putrescine ABC transporter substrate-binding protein, partial [Tissierellales bacterium]|nr:spermidine/putrescine ABC transporter substrate-binding protein [Tissierellales bacterium]
MKKSISILLVMVLIMSIFTGCAGTSEGADGESEETASTELNIYMWQQYISDDLIKSFEEENNATVNLSYMSDNADAITKLTAGGGEEYDLIMTCDAYMESLVDGDYIEKINFDNIPNASNINESYWTAKEYCVPYLMNYIYIVYNQDTSPVEITSYNDLIDPALKGQIATIDGARNLFPIALIALGYDPNSTNESEIAEAYEWLVKYNENVVAYGNAEQNLTNGTASVAFTYDGNASWAMSELGEDNNLVIADFEEDPVQLGFDLYVIPKGAK